MEQHSSGGSVLYGKHRFIYPFLDGNKRTGWGTARQFVRANGLELVCREAEFMYDHLFPL